MKITKLNIKKFRHIEDQVIEFGDKLTVITGQNGTGKSSVLGWIAQAFVFGSDIKTVTGKVFSSQYSEIFRFCKQNDYGNKYTISLVYKEDLDSTIEIEKIMETRHEKTEDRYRVDWDGRGTAIDFPVIYLGLKRLIPLATEKTISQKNIQLNDGEKSFFSRLSKKILILPDENISSEGVKSTNKDVLSMKTATYSHLGNSAGQDNIGQIISALISFKRLKEEQGENFQGGILLIDEIDATLYAASQIHLIDELHKFSRDNKIQIIFTTHSLEILEYLSKMTGTGTKINFLDIKDKTVTNKLNPSINLLINKIKVQTGQIEELPKIEIICEDEVTEAWCKNLLNRSDLKKLFHIGKGPFGYGDLINMAMSKHGAFKNIYFVLDGDCKKHFKEKKYPPRTVMLPGNKYPEKIFYTYLQGLSDNDPFWIENDDVNFSKQTCFNGYSSDEPTSVKKWFQNPKFKQLFGKSHSRLFQRWKKDNLELVNDFVGNFLKIIKK